MKQSEIGFTLVEILIAILLIGVATAGITSMFSSIQNLQRQSSYNDLATRAAQREIETLRGGGYSSLTAGQTINFTSQLPAGLPSNRNGSATVSQADNDLLRIDATVTYTSAGRQRTITLSSLLGAIGISK